MAQASLPACQGVSLLGRLYLRACRCGRGRLVGRLLLVGGGLVLVAAALLLVRGRGLLVDSHRFLGALQVSEQRLLEAGCALDVGGLRIELERFKRLVPLLAGGLTRRAAGAQAGLELVEGDEPSVV